MTRVLKKVAWWLFVAVLWIAAILAVAGLFGSAPST